MMNTGSYSVRIEILSRCLSENPGHGNNKFVKSMKKIDNINTKKNMRMVYEKVAPNEMILQEGWDVYSD